VSERVSSWLVGSVAGGVYQPQLLADGLSDVSNGVTKCVVQEWDFDFTKKISDWNQCYSKIAVKLLSNRRTYIWSHRGTKAGYNTLFITIQFCLQNIV